MYLDDHIRNSADLSPTIKLFLLTTASYADSRGICYPSQGTLARAMSMSRATVKRCLRECLELKLLEVRRRWRKSNVYRLLCLKPVQLSTMGSPDEPREQPPLVQDNVTRNAVDNHSQKPRWVSPREISILLADIGETLGEQLLEKNRGF